MTAPTVPAPPATADALAAVPVGPAVAGADSPSAGRVEALLPYEPQSAAAARRLVRTALLDWGPGELVEAGGVVVRELAGNAVKTGCRLTMTVTLQRITARSVRISVRDGSRAMPCRIDVGTVAESGRGLALVEHLTGGQWGATVEPYGKTVHADLRTRSARPELLADRSGPLLLPHRGGHHQHRREGDPHGPRTSAYQRRG